MLDPYRMVVVNLIALVILLLGLAIYKIRFPQKKINLLLLIFLISLLPCISLLRKGTYESGLLSEHVGVAYSFYSSLQEGIIRPLWSQKACSNYGCPLFIFQYPLPFYVASFFHFLGLSFLSSMKLLLGISFISSGLTMFYFLKNTINEKAGFIGSIFYLFAPYHLETMYFRVSIGEVLSFVFIPLVLLGCNRIIHQLKFKWIAFSSLSLALLVLSHQATSFSSMPIFLIYPIILTSTFKNKKIHRLVYSYISLLIGLGLSAFYWLPIIAEGKLIKIAHYTNVAFQPLWYYFYSPINYYFGMLFQGKNGELYTNIGYFHLLIVGIFVFLFLSKKIKKRFKHTALFLFILSLLYFVMVLEITKPIWLSTSLLYNMLFTWRFLIEISFLLSFLAAIILVNLNKVALTVIICFLAFSTTILNWGNRKTLPRITDANFVNAPLYVEKRCELFEGSSPVWVNECLPWIGNRQMQNLQIIKGQGDIREIFRRSTKHTYLVNAKTDMILKENTYFFPGWKILINNSSVNINYKNTKYQGLMLFEVPKGLSEIDVIFTNTPSVIAGEFITILTTILVSTLIIFTKIHKKGFD